jgi:Mce-associated membrane protein
MSAPEAPEAVQASAKDKSAKGKPTKDKPVKDKSGKDTSGKDKARKDKPQKEKPRKEGPGLGRRLALRAGRISPRVRVTIVVVLAVLVAGSGAGSGLLVAQNSADKAAQADRAAAAAAAKSEIQQILTYSYKTISADMSQASADTTGQFKGEYAVLANQTIGPQAKQQQTVNKAVVPVTAAVNSSGNQVTVLVFVDESTTNKLQPKAQVSGSQLLVTMQKVNGRWLVAQFDAM